MFYLRSANNLYLDFNFNYNVQKQPRRRCSYVVKVFKLIYDFLDQYIMLIYYVTCTCILHIIPHNHSGTISKFTPIVFTNPFGINHV